MKILLAIVVKLPRSVGIEELLFVYSARLYKAVGHYCSLEGAGL